MANHNAPLVANAYTPPNANPITMSLTNSRFSFKCGGNSAFLMGQLTVALTAATHTNYNHLANASTITLRLNDNNRDNIEAGISIFLQNPNTDIIPNKAAIINQISTSEPGNSPEGPRP